MSKGYGKSKTEAISISRPTQTHYDKGKVGRGTLLYVVGVQRGVVSRYPSLDVEQTGDMPQPA